MARARGFTLSWASRRTESRSSSSSSGRSKCTGEGYRTARPGIFWFLTPDDPARSSRPDQVTPGSTRSRADLQADLRKSRKKEQKRRTAGGGATLYALSFIVLVAALGVGGLYVYANYRFDQIKKVHAKHLVAAPAPPGKPFNLLLVGSDSRAFVSNATQVNAFGDEADAGGQRSDVTMVARFDPAAKTVTVLSIPRDLWVDIPGDVSGISGMNRINAAFNCGPDLLCRRSSRSWASRSTTTCRSASRASRAWSTRWAASPWTSRPRSRTSTRASTSPRRAARWSTGPPPSQLVRSRHLYYMDSNGYWEYDGLSDFSRIQRQDAFFRAVLAKVNASITNPLAINSFIGAAVGNLTIDDTLSQSDLLHIAEDFRGLPSSHLDHRDAAHDRLHDRRRGRRPQGWPSPTPRT